MYLVSSLGMMACDALTYVCFRVLTRTPYIPSPRDLSVLGKLIAAQSVLNCITGMVVLAMTLWTLGALYRNAGPVIARLIALLAVAIFIESCAMGMVDVAVSVPGWSDPMAPYRIRQEMGWWAAPATIYTVTVGKDLILGGLILGLIQVVRRRMEGPGFVVEVAGVESAREYGR